MNGMSSISEDKILISIVVLDKNQSSILESVDSCYTALKKLKEGSYEFFVVSTTDNPSLGLIELEKLYPKLPVFVLPYKTSYSSLAYYVMQKSKGVLVAVLNSDSIVNDDFFLRAISYYDKLNLFAIVPSVFESSSLVFGEEEETEGKTSLDNDFFPVFKTGLLQPAPSIYAKFGSAIYNRQRFISIGIDEKDNTIMDYDISLRAWSYGFGVLYDPSLKIVRLNRKKSFYFFKKLLWNINWIRLLTSCGFISKKTRFPFVEFFKSRIKRIDILGIITFFAGVILGLFKKKKVGTFYSPLKIIEITSKDSLVC